MNALLAHTPRMADSTASSVQVASQTDLPNQLLLTHILDAQRSGNNCLPEQLGLDAVAYSALLQRHFHSPLTRHRTEPCNSHDSPLQQAIQERGQLRQQLLDLRRDEWQELHDLLLQHRAGLDESEIWLAAIIAAACLGSSHLWRDLGLPSRDSLRQLLLHNFPLLARRNDRDMRWKKFFYKQLCEQQGGYVCRAPSCDQCPTHHECFGDEA